MKMHPYLAFNGQCREAFETYAQVFDGEVLFFQNFDEMPGSEELPEEIRGHVMHGQVSLQGQVLMGSDVMDPAMYQLPVGVNVQTGWDDPAQAKAVYDALLDGGEVIMPYEETFWSPGFGILRDRFGIPWMVNVNGEDA